MHTVYCAGKLSVVTEGMFLEMHLLFNVCFLVYAGIVVFMPFRVSSNAVLYLFYFEFCVGSGSISWA